MAKFQLSMSEVLSEYELKESFLGKTCSYKHIVLMADKIEDWEKIAPSLEVKADDVKASVSSSESSLCRRKCLQLWKKKAGFKATYYALLDILIKLDFGEVACGICEILKQAQRDDVISEPASRPLAEVGITTSRDGLAIPYGSKHGSGTSLTSTSSASPTHYMSKSANSLSCSASSDEAGQLAEGHGTGRIVTTGGYSVDVKKRYKQLHSQFISLLEHTRDRIDRVNINNTILRLSTPPSHLRQKEKFKFLQNNRMELLKFTSANELIVYLAEYWDELNPDILSYIIDYLEDQPLSDEYRSYEEELTQYLSDTTVDQAAGKFDGSDYRNGQNIELELPMVRQHSSLLSVRKLADDFGSAAHYNAPTRMKRVNISSVYLMLALPYPLDLGIFHSKAVQEFLHDNEVLRVIINGNCVFKNEVLDYAAQSSSECEMSEDEQTSSHVPKDFGRRESEYLKKLNRKRLSGKHEKKVSRSSLVLSEVGSRLYHQKEFMVIVSDGDIHPLGIEVSKRLSGDETLKKRWKSSRNFQGLSRSACFDLNMVADKIALSSMKEFKSLALDIKGEERSKSYYLQAIERFIEGCQYPGAYIWYIGHSEKRTGNWCFKDGTISFEELFDVYKGIQDFKALSLDGTPDDNGKLLAVISDCSYSGNWVHRCATILDSQKIPPCGHKTNEFALQIRVHCSAKEDQEAQQLCYSKKGVTATQDGDFSYRDTELSASQHTCCGDFTKLVCCKDPTEPCRMDEDITDWTWTDVVTGKLRKSIYIIQGRHQNRKHWYIILLFNKGDEFIKKYEAQVKLGEIETSKWGYVLQSGSGETPPRQVLNKVTQWTFV